ncbi:hypothetical protein DSO57_1036912 [Entomophthora muscae]|uniref:Uncharacterized protein n=1 Tax=Entomophthora muscae TaxID=34485 RepID=A0ACC2UJW8_9FUNG|nr:hypothetical protein DSO57_1036912 [Entomophthora muscae]
MGKWFGNFPKLEFGLSPEYIAQTRQYVSRSYGGAIIFAGIGMALGKQYFL